MKNFYINGIVCFLISNLTFFAEAQQEHVSELSVNPAAYNRSVLQLKSTIADTLELPFFDDFTYPSNKLNEFNWLDRNVSVNESYAIDPISTGTATFDALNLYGKIYDHAGVFPFEADHLTSKPINLEGKSNIYVSFFYQPEGFGDQPEVGDSLMLYFKSVPDNSWVPVWSVPGEGLHDFKQAMVPIDEDRFLKNGFQFRFTNKASLSKEPVPGLKTNTDHWHLDYLYLDENRSASDTTYNDVVFSQRIGSILENYSIVPWKHFPNARNQELKRKQLTLHVKNLNSLVLQVDIRYLFQDELNPLHQSTFTYNPANLKAGEDTTFIEDIDFDFILSESDDSAIFLVKTNLRGIDNDFNRVKNDTLIHYQKFEDFYAYDDGSAEAGYGFRGIGSEVAQLAYFYETYKDDSLRAIDIKFNPTIGDTLNGQSFWLTIWAFDEQNELPGNILYEKIEPVKAIETGFIRYELDAPIFMTGKFFIGWQQVYSNYLNIGYDRNRNNSENTYINFNGFWQNSGESGTLMIRPVFGEKKLVTHNFDETINNGHQEISVYPNPASDQLHINGLGQVRSWTATIYDLTGKVILTQPLTGNLLKVTSLEPGIYFLKVQNRLGVNHTKKIMISK